jgi:hypothetical protein
LSRAFGLRGCATKQERDESPGDSTQHVRSERAGEDGHVLPSNGNGNGDRRLAQDVGIKAIIDVPERVTSQSRLSLT